MSRVRLGALTAAGLVAGTVLAGPAPAAGAAACSGSTGVTVVVDFGSLGGGIQVGCAAGDPSSGLSALHAAGFGTTGTQRDGPGFVCRINGRPASDPCVRTPPASASWAYWHAARGGSWTYSSSGAASFDPAPGTVEGWAFGSGRRPGIAPPAVPAPPAPRPPAPKPTTRAPTRPPAPAPTSRPGAPGVPPAPSASASAPGSGSTGAGLPSVTVPASRSAPASVPAGPSGTAAATGAGGTAGSDPATPEATAGPERPAAEPVGSSRGIATFLLWLAVVVALGIGGFLVARRRRSA